METINEMKALCPSLFDCENYYEEAKASLKKRLEEKSEMWEDWTKSSKRYMLVCYLTVAKNDINNNPSGEISDYLDCHVSSNNLESLRLLWKSNFVQQRYDTTKQHFIADTKERKIIEFLSVCM